MIFQKIIYLSYFLLAMLLRWSSFFIPFERDEGEYLYAAKLLKEGLLPYQESFLQKPPAIVYLFQLLSTVGHSEWIYRFAATFSAFVSAVILDCILRKIVKASKLTSWISTFVFMVMMCMPIPFLWCTTANTEIFMMPFILLGIYWIMHHKSQFGAAMVFTIALLFKPIALGMVVPFALIGIIYYRPRDQNIPKALLNWTIGALVTLLIMMLPFLSSQAALLGFWESAVVYNWAYKDAYNGIAIFRNLAFFWKIYWPVLIPSLLGFLLAIQHWKKYIPWILGFGFSLFLLQKAQLPRYFIFIFPIVSIGWAYGLWQLNKHKYAKNLMFLFVLAPLYVLYPYRQRFIQDSEFLTPFLYPKDHLYASKMMGEYIEEQGIEDIYIAGSEPQILHYSKAKHLGKMIIKYPLMLNTPYAAHYQNIEIQLLKKKQPNYILTCQMPESWLAHQHTPNAYFNFLGEFLQHYSLVSALTIKQDGYHMMLEDHPSALFRLYKKTVETGL